MRIRKVLFGVVAGLLAAAVGLVLPLPPVGAQNFSTLSRVAGRFVASNYNWRGFVAVGQTGTSSQTYTLAFNTSLPDGRQFQPFGTGPFLVPVTFDIGSNQETITPTAVSTSTCPASVSANLTCVSFTGSFTYAHGLNAVIASGTGGAQEAAIDAFASGGGAVVVDSTWNAPLTSGGAGQQNNILAALVPFSTVTVEDDRAGIAQYWNLAPASTTVLVVPTAIVSAAACTATAQNCSDGTVAGSASWGSTVYIADTCVDMMGQETIASTTVSWTSVASKAIDLGNPAAEAGCVGWKPYVSVSGGSYALAYDIPLLTQPTVLQAVPLSAAVCQLTTLEPITPACKIPNATYGQVGSTTGANGTFLGGAQVTGYPVVTSQLAPNLDSVSSQQLNPSNAAVKYVYTPGSRVGIPGIVSSYNSFPVTSAAQTLIGQVAGSIPLAPGFMNYPGRTIEVCGMLSKTSTVADTITNIQLWWDAEGSNVTAGTAVQLSNIQDTATLTAAANFTFCQDITTTVASASATGGTIVPGAGWDTLSQTSAGTIHFASTNNLFAAVGSLNLALNAKLEVVYNHTTGTDGAGVVLVNPTVKVLN